MGMYDSPAIPAQPDYAASAREGAVTDAQLLPFKLAVDRAARLGTKYTDPQTGQTYDFSQLGGDRALIDMDVDAQKRLMESGADLTRNLERNRLNDLVDLLPRYNDLNLAAQRRAMEDGLKMSDLFTKNQLEQDLAYRPRFGELTRAEDAKTFAQNMNLGEQATRQTARLQSELLPIMNAAQRAEDAKTFEQNLTLGQNATRRQTALMTELQPIINAMARSEQGKDFLQQLQQGDAATRQAANLQNELLPAANRAGLAAQTEAEQARQAALRTTDPTRYALRQKLMEDATSELEAGANLTPRQMERLQQQIRGAQAARGNILGAGAGYDEARMAQEAGESQLQQRRQNALQVLTGSDIAPRFAVTGAPGSQPGGQRDSYGVPTLTPNYQTAQMVNPLMPNYQSTPGVNPVVPNLQATTASGPNLAPTNISRSGNFSYINPNASSEATNYANQGWQTMAQIKSQEVNPWMAGLSLAFQGLGAAGGIAGLKALP